MSAMPLYQMLCIAVHQPEYAPIKALVTQSCTHLLNNGGAIRKLEHWGTLVLPQRMTKNKATYTMGDYWTVHFDTSPRVVRSLGNLMRKEPLVLRWTFLKLAEKVEDVEKVGRTLIRGDIFDEASERR